MLVVAIVMIGGCLLVGLVGVTFSIINHVRCKSGKRPIGYGSNATCEDMYKPVDPFTRHPKHPIRRL